MARKGFFVPLLLAVSATASFAVLSPALEQADDSLGSIMQGNKRFVAGIRSWKNIGDSRRKELTAGQHPFAIVVTCSDSRVAPEVVFDQGLGDIFVVRVAGNVLDSVALGSIEYAAEHLHTPLLILMGHEKCGAVTAAVEAQGEPEGNIGAIVRKIIPAVNKARKQGGTKDEIVANAIKQNVFQSYEDMIKLSPVLKHMISKGELTVVEALYHLGSGEVEVMKAETAASAKERSKAQ